MSGFDAARRNPKIWFAYLLQFVSFADRIVIGTFFSLSFSPHKGAASVGMLLTMAISVMLLVTFVVLPALLDMLQRKREP